MDRCGRNRFSSSAHSLQNSPATPTLNALFLLPAKEKPTPIASGLLPPNLVQDRPADRIFATEGGIR